MTTSSQSSHCKVCGVALPNQIVRSPWAILCDVCLSNQKAIGAYVETAMPTSQLTKIAPEGRQDGLGQDVKASQGLGPGGKKNDAGKDRWDLLAPLWWVIQGVVQVLTYGAKTYDDNSWQSVPNGMARYEAAAHRHRMKRLDGEWVDPESKLPHIFHELCNQMFVAYLVWREKQ